MTPVPLPDLTAVVCLFSIFLVPLAAAGLALINAGLGRSRNTAHMMLGSLCAIAVAAGVYFVCGFGFQGFSGGPAHVIVLGGKPWNWLAMEPWFFRSLKLKGLSGGLAACLGMVSVSLSALIPLGAGAERWRLGAICSSTALLAGWTFPLFAHWVWSGGWLAQLGVNFGLGRGFLDAGGAGAIHAVGGLTALSIAWILGPRRGKYSMEGMPAAIPGHNSVFVLFGCLLALIGWLGLNSAGSILLGGGDAETLVSAGVNTILAAGGGLLAAALVTRARFGKPDASLSANGWVAGLVASSAGGGLIAPAGAVLIGIVAGGLATLAVEWLELRLGVDDPGGVISVHAVGGLWGLLAVGCFNRLPGSSGSGQWLAQLVGVATLVGFVLPLTYGMNWFLNRISPQRVALDGERRGMDLHELGANAYPELVSHIEDFTQR